MQTLKDKEKFPMDLVELRRRALNRTGTDQQIDTPLTQPRSAPVLAGEVLAEAVSMLMDAGVNLSDIAGHLRTELGWCEQELARINRAV